MLVKYDRGTKQIGFWRTNCTELWSSLQDVYDGENRPIDSSPTPTPTPKTEVKNPPIDSSPTPKNEVENSPAGQPVAASGPGVSIKIPGKYYDYFNLYRELKKFCSCFIIPA